MATDPYYGSIQLQNTFDMQKVYQLQNTFDMQKVYQQKAYEIFHQTYPQNYAALEITAQSSTGYSIAKRSNKKLLLLKRRES